MWLVLSPAAWGTSGYEKGAQSLHHLLLKAIKTAFSVTEWVFFSISLAQAITIITPKEQKTNSSPLSKAQ